MNGQVANYIIILAIIQRLIIRAIFKGGFLNIFNIFLCPKHVLRLLKNGGSLKINKDYLFYNIFRKKTNQWNLEGNKKDYSINRFLSIRNYLSHSFLAAYQNMGFLDLKLLLR